MTPDVARLPSAGRHDDPTRLTALAGNVDWTAAGPGDILLLTMQGPVVVAGIVPVAGEQAVQLTTLADLTSRSAILLPGKAGSDLSEFEPGTYTFTFEINRSRYDSTDPVDSTSRYRRTAGFTASRSDPGWTGEPAESSTVPKLSCAHRWVTTR